METLLADGDELVSRKHLFIRHAKDMTIAVGVLEILYSLLAFIDRLNPTVSSRFFTVDLLIEDTFWAGAFLLSGIFVLVSLKNNLKPGVSMAIATAVLLVWGMLCLLKTWTAVQPVAWSVGLSALALGVLSYKLCVVWNTLTLEPAEFKG